MFNLKTKKTEKQNLSHLLNVARWNYFSWNLRFNFLHIKTLIFFIFLLGGSIILAIFASNFWHKYPISSSKDVAIRLPIVFSFLFPMCLWIPFIRSIFTSCFLILEEKQNRATEITISSVGTKFSFITKLLVNIIWFISFWIAIFLLFSVLSLILIGEFNPLFIFYWIAGIKINHLPPNFLFVQGGPSILNNSIFAVRSFGIYLTLNAINIFANLVFYISLCVAVSSAFANIKGGLGFLVFLYLAPNLLEFILLQIGVNPFLMFKVFSFIPVTSTFFLNTVLLTCADSNGYLPNYLISAPFVVLFFAILGIIPGYIFYSRAILTDGLWKTIKSFTRKGLKKKLTVA